MQISNVNFSLGPPLFTYLCLYPLIVFRRLMIEKIAAHLADFSPRLQSNTRALYQYCPIPVINYPQLENELFCNIYYLKHFCDTLRFPDWPIKDPVSHVYRICFCSMFLSVWYCPFNTKIGTNGKNVALFSAKVKLLKDTLDSWKKEVEKKPPTMSIEDAYDVLGLPKGQGP